MKFVEAVLGEAHLQRSISKSALVVALLGLAACAAEGPTVKNVYFGDLHLHTRYSNDAFYLTTEENIDDAYDFAKGEEVVRSDGNGVQLKTPLDFLAVTEHAEFLGALESFTDPNHPLYDHPELGRLLRSPETDERMKAWIAFMKAMRSDGTLEGYDEAALKAAVWGTIVEAADRHNDPGTFTTFAAYEWTAYIEGGNMHRNVIFKDTSDLPIPFTAEDSLHPEDLWSFLEQVRAGGDEVLAIPHNSNLSDGRMFALNDSRGGAIDQSYAARRTRNEPVVEITQNKGTSETHPDLSPDDPFSGHEIFSKLLEGFDVVGNVEGSYVRDALALGVGAKASRGYNPFQFGFVGATDSHSALSIIDDNNVPGFAGATYDPTPESRWGRMAWNGLPYWALSASGVTGVWAEENTKEQIFAALERRETYATTGPRIRLRAFAGWNLDQDLFDQSDWAGQAAASGVAMGTPLPQYENGAPQIAVWAAKDPKGANLDRIQIIKGWSDGTNSQTKIYDVAWSGDREPDDKGRVPAVGNSVDVAAASYTNDIGAAELNAVWTDPDFDPELPAFYYVRVIEIPTPRWSTFDAKALGETVPDDMPATIQERAFASPFWFEP